MRHKFFLQAYLKRKQTNGLVSTYMLTKPWPKLISKTRRANNNVHFCLAATVYSSCCIQQLLYYILLFCSALNGHLSLVHANYAHDDHLMQVRAQNIEVWFGKLKEMQLN